MAKLTAAEVVKELREQARHTEQHAEQNQWPRRDQLLAKRDAYIVAADLVEANLVRAQKRTK